MEVRDWHKQARDHVIPRPRRITTTDLNRWDRRELDAWKDRSVGWLRQLLLQPAVIQQLWATMEEVVESNRHTPPGAKTILALTAPNTAGKSTVARHWALSLYRSWLSPGQIGGEDLPTWRPTRNIEADYVPIVWVNMGPYSARSSGPIAFNTELLTFLGHSSEGPLRATNQRVVRTTALQGVRLVIVDDIHLLRTNYKDGQMVLDHLKYINTALGERHATLMLIGANLHGSDIFADPQIAGRLRVVELPTYPIDTIEQKQTWQGLLKDAESELLKYLPRAEPGFLVTRAPLLWRRTQGYLGDLGNLLRRASVEAVTSEAWAIDEEMLARPVLSERAAREEERISLQRKQRSPE